jgi:hypothetical protein
MNMRGTMLYRHARHASLLLPLLFLFAGCSESGTEPEADADTANDFAQVFLMLSGEMNFAGPGELPVTLPCPAGGTRRLDGNFATGSNDAELTATWSLEALYSDCAFNLQETMLTLTGTMTSTGQTKYRLPAEQGQPGILLEYSSRSFGQMTTRSGQGTQTCGFDTTVQFDPALNVLRMMGTSCGHTINITRPVM